MDKSGKPNSSHAPKPPPPTSTSMKDGRLTTEMTAAELNNPDVYFIIPRTVQILYGPYMYQGIMDYRTERLQGLKTFLEKFGVTVELKPCLDHVNLARVWFLEEPVFACKLTSLMHGGDGELDPVCWEAAAALDKFINTVLKGLRHSRPVGPEDLKRPFCPCFHKEDHKEVQTLAETKEQENKGEQSQSQSHPIPQ